MTRVITLNPREEPSSSSSRPALTKRNSKYPLSPPLSCGHKVFQSLGYEAECMRALQWLVLQLRIARTFCSERQSFELDDPKRHVIPAISLKRPGARDACPLSKPTPAPRHRGTNRLRDRDTETERERERNKKEDIHAQRERGRETERDGERRRETGRDGERRERERDIYIYISR